MWHRHEVEAIRDSGWGSSSSWPRCSSPVPFRHTWSGGGHGGEAMASTVGTVGRPWLPRRARLGGHGFHGGHGWGRRGVTIGVGPYWGPYWGVWVSVCYPMLILCLPYTYPPGYAQPSQAVVDPAALITTFLVLL